MKTAFLFSFILLLQKSSFCLSLATPKPVSPYSPKPTDGSRSGVASSPKPKKNNLYDESLHMLWASTLVYDFAALVLAERTGKIQLEYPPTIPTSTLERFQDESIDFRGLFDIGDGLVGGMPFRVIADTLSSSVNKEQIIELIGEEESRHLASIIGKIRADANEYMGETAFTLETFRSLKQKVACVYGIVKDRKNKRIIITFRGSVSGNRDWAQNFKAFKKDMKTPKFIRGKMEGSLKRNLIVHQGFYEYMFDNEFLDDDEDSSQRYKNILKDIKDLIEDDYQVYVTGHSLGAALSSLTSLKLAGSNKKWLPKPITCISFASPFNGGSEFRTVFQKLEEEGLVRYLRVVNNDDIVPSIPPFFLSLWPKTMKHVGINLRLWNRRTPEISHPNTHNELSAALKNNFLFKMLIFLVMYAIFDIRFKLKFPLPLEITYSPHSTELHEEHLDKHAEFLQGFTLDELYDDAEIMGNKKKSGNDEL